MEKSKGQDGKEDERMGTNKAEEVTQQIWDLMLSKYVMINPYDRRVEVHRAG